MTDQTAITRAVKPNGRRHGILLIRWIVPVVIIAIFILTGHLGEAIAALRDVSMTWAMLLVLVGIVLPVSHAWRWTLLLRRTGSVLSVMASTQITALASLINYAAPGFLGAPAKAILARNGHGLPLSRSLPTLAVEQLLDALALLTAGMMALLILGPATVLRIEMAAFAERIPLVAVVALSFAVVLFLGWRIARRLLPTFLHALSEATLLLARSREAGVSILALTGLRWVLDMAAIWVASSAIGLRLGLLDVLLIANLSLLAGMIAPVPGGLGVREAVMAGVAGAIGVSIPAVLALSVLHRAGLGVGLPSALGLARGYEWSRR
jgi:glycosyltransferase 2 family protein